MEGEYDLCVLLLGGRCFLDEHHAHRNPAIPGDAAYGLRASPGGGPAGSRSTAG